MNPRMFIGLLGLAAASAATPAVAQQPLYLGASIGRATYTEGCNLLFNFSPVTCDKHDTAWKVFGGYQFSRHFAAEVGYANLGAVHTTRTNGAQEIAASAFDATLVGTYRIGSLALLGRLGAYYGSADAAGLLTGSKTESNLTLGFGLEYALTPNLGIRGEWQRYVQLEATGIAPRAPKAETGATDVNVLGVALVWRAKGLDMAAADAAASKAYLGGNLGASLYKIECISGLSCENRDTGARLFAGYQFTPSVSAEVGYAHLGRATISGIGGTDELAASAYDLTALFHVPFSDSPFSVFGRGGAYLGTMRLSGADRGTNTSIGLTLGFGVGYDLGRSLGMRLEWQRYAEMKARNDVTGFEDVGDVGLLSIGVIYRFQ